MPTELPFPNENDQPGYFFPGFLPKHWTNRTLAYFDGINLIDEYEDSSAILNFSHFMGDVFGRNLLTFVSSILDFRYLDQAIDAKGIIYCTATGIPTALQLHGKANGHHCTRWIIQSSAWQQHHPDRRLLARLRTLYEHCGVGVASTPGALGIKLQKQALYHEYGDDWYGHRHPLPPYRCVQDLQAFSTGARSDQLAETTLTLDKAWELDMKNGYGAAFIEQPDGPAIPHQGRHLEQYATFVSHCTVFITDELVLGCFPVRVESGHETRVEYPTKPGTYKTFLWKEEIELATSVGCNIIEGPGWGWLSMTSDNARWVTRMTDLRDTAPPEIVDWVKLAIVAGIGRHGCSWASTFLVPEGEQNEGDLEASWHGLCYDYYVHSAMLQPPESMQHWFSYTLMKCRLALYKAALPFAEKGQLLATDTDGIYVSDEADVSSYPEKSNAIGLPAGTWRKSELSHVSFPALRHLVSDQKEKRPGRRKNDA